MNASSTQGRGPDTLVVRATGLTKRFGDKVALNGASFEMHRGEIHALLGENGAGKSTLISILCGQYRPDAGSVEVHGRLEHFHSPRAALAAVVGVVHQDVRLVPPFTVLENVVLGTSMGQGKGTRRACLAMGERGIRAGHSLPTQDDVARQFLDVISVAAQL